jgi:uncharacterized protein YoxC
MTPVDIAIIISAVAFVVLVVFLARLLHNTCKTLHKVQMQLDDLGHEPRDVLLNTNQLASDIQAKMKCLDPLFYALANVGVGLESKTSSLCDTSVCSCCRAKRTSERDTEETAAMRYARLALVGASIWQDLQKRK